MSNLSRTLLGIASLLLIGLFFFPLWQITLEAPQYPEGLRMDIWINKISGNSEHILQNINILNHYIGMQLIDPESIPELKILPYIISAFIFSGFLFSLLRKKSLLLFWIIAFILFGIIGIYDFYLWEYNYGHNLDPNAPIKVPGMVYQPPLFGEKMLLNFKAASYPATGGILAAIASCIAMLATVYEFFIKKRT